VILSSRGIAPFFDLLDWSQVWERDESQPWPGSSPHPEQAHVKALLVKKYEKFDYVTDLRRFLVKHPLLVLEIGFHPIKDSSKPYGFDVEETVPCDRWLRHKQQVMDNISSKRFSAVQFMSYKPKFQIWAIHQ